MARTKSFSARTRNDPAEAGEAIWSRVVWLGLLLAWTFVAASLLSFDRADPPSAAAWPVNDPIRNWCGPAGAYLAYALLRFMGWGAWLVLGLTGLGLIGPLFARRVEHPILRAVGILLLLAAACGLVGLAAPRAGPVGHLPGGELGLVIAAELGSRFGGVGASLWLILLGFVGLVVAFDRLVFAVPAAIWRHFAPAAQTAGAKAVSGAGAGAAVTARAGGGLFGALATMVKNRMPVAVKLTDLEDEDIAEAETKANEVATRRAGKPRRKITLEPKAEIDEESLDAESVVTEDELEEEYEDEYEEDEYEDGEYEEEDEEDEDLPGAPQIYSEDQLREKIAALPVRFSGSDRKLATDEDLRDLQNVEELEGYRFPGLDLLEEPEEDFNATIEKIVREQAEALESALQQYRIDGEVVRIESGPVITQYDVRLAPGTKVAALSAVSSDIARALRAVNIRIVTNQEGRDTVGVEVPNPTKEKVRLRELMSNRESFSSMKLPMFLGKDASGEPLIADLTKMPHMLIAGTTGSGKSVCMNTIIMSFLYTKKPNELKLVLVDPKMVEMSQFKDIPHLMCPVITEMAKAAAILEWACKKMDERYELLAEAGVRDIAGYNALEWEELRERMEPANEDEEARIPRKLPYMVFVIDELADMMMTNKEVEGSIVRIAQKARAVGIHLILATQRPQANVVTGLIKSNMPCRVTFKVASGMDSRIVLDQKGGELLLGQGDMLFLSPRSSKLTRAQGTMVEDGEIRKAVRFLRDIAAPSFERQLVQIRSGDTDEERIVASENNSSASLAAAQEDPMFDRAVEIVLETRRGSVSLLQRRLAIGYTRASRLIDLMGISGIISDHKGSVARDVLITPEDWGTMKRLADEEATSTGQEPVFGSGSGTLFPEEETETDGEPDGKGTTAVEEAPFETEEPDEEDEAENEVVEEDEAEDEEWDEEEDVDDSNDDDEEDDDEEEEEEGEEEEEEEEEDEWEDEPEDDPDSEHPEKLSESA
ncbi:DNA translocase FtsK [hydrothermal vent metagenome]|uniref:DNA translocase FtsK n=1 Tax=hydrothermal vent metagenome TaxID=652676 RepID=A0A3B1DTJ7_9ZZZZ